MQCHPSHLTEKKSAESPGPEAQLTCVCWINVETVAAAGFDVRLCVHSLTLHLEGKITAARSFVSSVKQPEDWRGNQ